MLERNEPLLRSMAAVLFADIKGFSHLEDHQIESVPMAVLPKMAEVIHKYNPMSVNTWGDAVFGVFSDPGVAAHCALDLRDLFRNPTSWGSSNMPRELGIRIALHAATLARFFNPITKKPDALGRNVNLAARIEPIVRPNEVWASHAYVTQLHAAGLLPNTFKSERIGELELVKGWGKEDLYRICRSYETLAQVERPIATDRLIGTRGETDVLRAMHEIIKKAKESNGFLRVAGIANKDLFQPSGPSALEAAFTNLLSSGELQDLRVLFLNPDQVSRKIREAFETRPREVMVYTEQAIRVSLEAVTGYRDKSRNFQARTAAEIPCFLFFNQEEMLCHPYLNSSVGPATKVILTVKGNKMYADGCKHFENLWSERWVLFDLGNVLVDFDHSQISSKLWEELNTRGALGSVVPAVSAIHDFFFQGEVSGPSKNDQLDLGHHSLDWLRQRFCDEFHCAIDLNTFRECWNSIFGRLNAEAVACIQSLHEMGINVGICSNTNEAHWHYVRSNYQDIVKSANEWFLSFETNWRKPDAKFFDSIWKETKVPVSHHLLIDDLEVNVQGARNAGMEAEVFSGFHKVIERVKELFWNSTYPQDLALAHQRHRNCRHTEMA